MKILNKLDEHNIPSTLILPSKTVYFFKTIFQLVLMPIFPCLLPTFFLNNQYYKNVSHPKW